MGTNKLLPGTLDMLVLKTLSRGANHGYGIAQHIQSVCSDALKVGEGSLYPALQRLLINERVQAEWGLSDNNRKARIYKLQPPPAASALPKSARALTP
jgi:PadR family transcriptional regulator, regulatory protein PadR